MSQMLAYEIPSALESSWAIPESRLKRSLLNVFDDIRRASQDNTSQGAQRPPKPVIGPRINVVSNEIEIRKKIDAYLMDGLLA